MRAWGWTFGGGAPLVMVGAEPRVRVGAWVFARGPGAVSADMRGPDKRNGGHQDAVIRGAAASPRGGACRVPPPSEGCSFSRFTPRTYFYPNCARIF